MVAGTFIYDNTLNYFGESPEVQTIGSHLSIARGLLLVEWRIAAPKLTLS
jgi:hypothetical protein